MTTRHCRVTISLPTDLLEGVDNQLAQPDETRSAVIRRLIEQALRDARQRDDVEAWVRSYRERPQAEEDDGLWTSGFPPGMAVDLPWE